MATNTPNVLWAQRTDRILLTIDLQDAKDVKINLQPTSLSFSAEQGTKHYELKLDFLEELNVEQSRWGVLARHIQMNLVKKEGGPYWERLTKDSGKKWFLKTDWQRWVDEDEQEKKGGGSSDFNFDDLDMGGDYGGFGGGGMEDEDDEVNDDEMPELEDDKTTEAEPKSDETHAEPTGTADHSHAAESTQTPAEEPKKD